jgi:hypothetical protein
MPFRWGKFAQPALILVLAATPVFAVIRYRWPQVLLPIGTVPALALIVHSAGIPSVAASLRAWFRNPIAILGFALAGWVILSIGWSLDRAFALMTAVKALFGIASAIIVAQAVPKLDQGPLHRAILALTVFAAIAAIITAMTKGVVHQIFGCCGNDMQAQMSGAAAMISLFIPVCAGWLLLQERNWAAVAMLVLGCGVIAVSQSGASGLAFVAGAFTCLLGQRYPRVAVMIPLLIFSLGFLAALHLADLRHLTFSGSLLDKLANFHAGERVAIWTFYQDVFWQRPWTGFGIAAERIVGNGDGAAFSRIMAPNNANLHTHNETFQILFEFGFIGAALAWATIAAATHRLARNANFRTAIAVSPIAGFAAAGLVNFGLWEWWWMSGMLIATIVAFRLRLEGLFEPPCRRIAD